ncbi:hypothetical protein [Hyphomicrobium methylovorum]|uniref:hypothetical protein n=1 Tax=Hyphomicrobium methylovorum TaxID=84 RepID=UPI0015E6F65D|nr:hypothetical protein [Hyphomicrobium methylovorum]
MKVLSLRRFRYLLLSFLATAMPVIVVAADLDRTQVIAQIAAAAPGEAPDLTGKDLAGVDLSGVDFKGLIYSPRT